MPTLKNSYSTIEKRLLQLYPDKVVNNITIDDKSLYAKIRYYAKKESLSPSEFITSLGFMFKSENGKSTERKCNRCSKLLPDDYHLKTCVECSNKNKSANKQRRIQLKSEHKCISCRVDLPADYEFVQCQNCLDAMNKRITTLRQERVENHMCEDCGVDLDTNYHNRKCPDCKAKYNAYCLKNSSEPTSKVIYTAEYISGLLYDAYKNDPISNLQRDHYNLYHAIYRNAQTLNLSVPEYVESLGFKFEKNL